MLALGLAMGIAALIPLLTGGSYMRLVMAPWRWAGLLLAGFGIQLFLDLVDIPEQHWDTLGYGLLVASYVLILGFCFGNLLIKGMTIVMIGIACNAIVIVANQGMPVDVPQDWIDSGWAEATIKHHPEDGDVLMFLGDIIVLRSPFNVIISFGDLILAVGLCDVAYHASRKPQRRHGDGDDLEGDQHRTRGDVSQPATAAVLSSVDAGPDVRADEPEAIAIDLAALEPGDPVDLSDRNSV